MNKIKVTCVFCRCLIAVKAGDKSRFRDHMNTEHDVRVDTETMEVLMVVTIMTEGERKKLINDYSVKVTDRLRPKNVKVLKLNMEVFCPDTINTYLNIYINFPPCIRFLSKLVT